MNSVLLEGLLVLILICLGVYIGFLVGLSSVEDCVINSSVSYNNVSSVRFLTNCDVWNESKPIFDSGVMGYYSSRGYFAVVTKDRSIDEIARTTFHELSHVYNRMFPEHFINDFNSSVRSE